MTATRISNDLITVALLWENVPDFLTVTVEHGDLAELKPASGTGTVEGNRINFKPDSTPIPIRIHLTCRNAQVGLGYPATTVAIKSSAAAFTFFLRDVTAAAPIFLPSFAVAIVPASDKRTYPEIAAAVQDLGGRTKLEKLEQEPEEDFVTALANTRQMECPTRLGVYHDVRIFEIDVDRLSPIIDISPRFHNAPVRVRETDFNVLAYKMIMTRGEGCSFVRRRRLEDGTLPILHVEFEDDDILYETVMFCSLESDPLAPERIRGTHFMIGDGFSSSHHFTPEQALLFQEILAKETTWDADEIMDYCESLALPNMTHAMGHGFDADARALFHKRWQAVKERDLEETIMCCQVRISNTARVPRYAWFKAPMPIKIKETAYNPKTGFGSFTASGRVFCVAKINGQPLPNPEVAVLLAPGQVMTVDLVLPHYPVSLARAEQLAKISFKEHHAACRKFWQGRINSGARLEIPEPHLNEMLQAGVPHLELVMYGRAPDGPLTPSCGGTYSALALESIDMIRFMDSLGQHDIARRCLDFFLEKQHEDGHIQSYATHQSDPGPVLMAFAEHYRYTRDDQWFQEYAPRLLKTADFLLAWRERNMSEELRGRGYGLIDGQMADMRETNHHYKLNSIACCGILTFAETLAAFMPEEAQRLKAAGTAWKADILASVEQSLAKSPVVPLGDGSWITSLPPFPELPWPACLYNKLNAWTHGTFLTRDNCVPSDLILYGIMPPDDPRANLFLNYVCELFHQGNVRHSQPYISRHALLHLQRGEVKAFLKSFYNTIPSLADRETYTFWEHMHANGKHKTEGESGFLMQARYMLWMEENDTLTLLPGIPRAWLRSGQKIQLTNIATWFGRTSLTVESDLTNTGTITAKYQLDAKRRPQTLRLRLPHPRGHQPTRISIGTYDAVREWVTIENPQSEESVSLEYY